MQNEETDLDPRLLDIIRNNRAYFQEIATYSPLRLPMRNRLVLKHPTRRTTNYADEFWAKQPLDTSAGPVPLLRQSQAKLSEVSEYRQSFIARDGIDIVWNQVRIKPVLNKPFLDRTTYRTTYLGAQGMRAQPERPKNNLQVCRDLQMRGSSVYNSQFKVKSGKKPSACPIKSKFMLFAGPRVKTESTYVSHFRRRALEQDPSFPRGKSLADQSSRKQSFEGQFATEYKWQFVGKRRTADRTGLVKGFQKIIPF